MPRSSLLDREEDSFDETLHILRYKSLWKINTFTGFYILFLGFTRSSAKVYTTRIQHFSKQSFGFRLGNVPTFTPSRLHRVGQIDSSISGRLSLLSGMSTVLLIKTLNLTLTVVYTGFRGWGGVPAGLGGILFYIGEIKNFAFFQTRKFSKNVKKSMKIL